MKPALWFLVIKVLLFLGDAVILVVDGARNWSHESSKRYIQRDNRSKSCKSTMQNVEEEMVYKARVITKMYKEEGME